MESIDERNYLGPLKRLIYFFKLNHNFYRPSFILAIGEKMPAWLTARGFPKERIFPFAYFLPSLPLNFDEIEEQKTPFKFGFVGKLIQLKRLDLLVEALSKLKDQEFELVVIGDGPLKKNLHKQAVSLLGTERIHFLGTLAMDETRRQIAMMDCLVLPSDYDGWGAVVSEALLAGVPAICSDACGAVSAVLASEVGGVFRKGDVEDLRRQLQKQLSYDRAIAVERIKIADWARCLDAEAGAEYVDQIVDFLYNNGGRPIPVWRKYLE